MTAPLRVLLVAGEASGDLHGAGLLRALRRRVPDVEAWGIGGENLRAAGMHTAVDTSSVATMGFVETFGTIGRLLRAYRQLIRFLDERRPALVILIDYPEFNFQIARQAKKRGIPVFYFIGPQVWAWRRGRARKLPRRVDRIGVVFPFEPELYNTEGRNVAEFVGHPLLDVVRQTATAEETRARYGVSPGQRVLALLPGSRKKELRYLLRPMCAAAELLRSDGWKPILALAPTLADADLADELGGQLPPFPIARGDTYNIVAAADAAIVASGTATLETALLGCPMVIVYRVSPVTYWLARALVRIEWIGMPNILLRRGVFPELIQRAVTPTAMAEAVRGLMHRREEITQALTEVRASLGTAGAADRAAALALELAR